MRGFSASLTASQTLSISALFARASPAMIGLQFLATALVIVVAGVRLARYGDVLGEKTGLGRSWIGVVLLAATTSLPELFTGFGATALAALPDIALGDVLGGVAEVAGCAVARLEPCSAQPITNPSMASTTTPAATPNTRRRRAPRECGGWPEFTSRVSRTRASRPRLAAATPSTLRD